MILRHLPEHWPTAWAEYAEENEAARCEYDCNPTTVRVLAFSTGRPTPLNELRAAYDMAAYKAGRSRKAA